MVLISVLWLSSAFGWLKVNAFVIAISIALATIDIYVTDKINKLYIEEFGAKSFIANVMKMFGINLATLLDAKEYVTYAFWASAVGPALEEMLFRGFLLHALLPFGTTVAVAISSLAFAIMHIQYGLTGKAKVFLYALAFSVLTLATGSILPALAFHSVHNYMILRRARSALMSMLGEKVHAFSKETETFVIE